MKKKGTPENKIIWPIRKIDTKSLVKNLTPLREDKGDQNEYQERTEQKNAATHEETVKWSLATDISTLFQSQKRTQEIDTGLISHINTTPILV